MNALARRSGTLLLALLVLVAIAAVVALAIGGKPIPSFLNAVIVAGVGAVAGISVPHSELTTAETAIAGKTPAADITELRTLIVTELEAHLAELHAPTTASASATPAAEPAVARPLPTPAP